MQKKLPFILVLWLLLAFSNAYAQYVEKDNNDATTNIINCSNMPTQSVETNMSSVKYSESHTGNAFIAGQVKRHINTKGNGTSPNVNPDVNAKVSVRFEVASADLTESLTWSQAMGYDEGVNDDNDQNPTSWTGTGCAGYDQSGSTSKGVWRLPTQGELMIIYILRNKLKNSNFIKSNYWSATENVSPNKNASWVVSFDAGYTGYGYKIHAFFKARCVRDL